MVYLVGYKGHSCLIWQPSNFFISRDVIFHENTFPFASLSSQPLEFPIQPALILLQLVLNSPSLDPIAKLVAPTEPSVELDIVPPRDLHMPN